LSLDRSIPHIVSDVHHRAGKLSSLWQRQENRAAMSALLYREWPSRKSTDPALRRLASYLKEDALTNISG
jgi:hypothetical protein